jgi:hypothetical protein
MKNQIIWGSNPEIIEGKRETFSKQEELKQGIKSHWIEAYSKGGNNSTSS